MYVLVALALLLRVGFCQTGSDAFGYNGLCNASFADANATGIYYYNPHVDQGQQAGQPDNDSGKTQNIGVAFTVAQTNDSRLTDTIWFYTHGANYSDDFGLGYDVCGMSFGPFPNNTNLRGQADNGSCTTMFDTDCVNAIEMAVENFALELTSNPTPQPNSNLTRDSLPGVCQDIATMLTNNIPDECSKYVYTNGSTVAATPTALTGYNESVVYGQDCNLVDDGRVWHELITYTVDYSHETYSILTQTVNPIIAVWMPIANANRPSTIVSSKAGMICANTNNYNPGSLRLAPLPAPTPVGGGGGLSGGAIAGIVVGVVVGVGLIAGLAAWWFLSKRRKAKKSAGSGAVGGEFDEKDTQDMSGSIAGGGSQEVKNSQNSPVEAPAGQRPIAELPQQDFRPELDAGKDNQVFESDAKVGGSAVELEGSAPKGQK